MTPLNSNTGITTVIILLCTCTAIKTHVLKRSTESNDPTVLANDNPRQNNTEDVTINDTNVIRDDTKWFIPVWISPVQTLFEYVTSDDRFKSIVKARELDLSRDGSRPGVSDDKNTEIFRTSSGRNINQFTGDNEVLDDVDRAVGASDGQGENNVQEPNIEFSDFKEIVQAETESSLAETNGLERMLTAKAEPEGDIGITNNVEGPSEISQVESGDDMATDGIREYIDVNDNNELSDTNKVADGLDSFIDELEAELANSDIETNTQTAGTSIDTSEPPDFSNGVLGTDRDLLSESNDLDNHVETTETESFNFPNFEMDQDWLTTSSEIDDQVDTTKGMLDNYDDNSNTESENNQNTDKSDDTWRTLKERICDQDYSPSTSFIAPVSLGLARTTFLLSTQSLFLVDKLQRELCAENENDNIEITPGSNTEEIDIPVPFIETTDIDPVMFESAAELPDITDANANENQSITDDFIDVSDIGFDSTAVEEDVSRQDYDATEVFVEEVNPEVNTETETIDEDV